MAHLPESNRLTRKRSAHFPDAPLKRARTQSSTSLPKNPSSPVIQSTQARQENANKWFDRANEHGAELRNMPFIDSQCSVFTPTYHSVNHSVDDFVDDPPFFLKNNADEASLLAQRSELSMPEQPERIGPTAPTASLLAQMNASNARNDGGSDDFRDVIDDLTVQNKKLKRKLMKYERLHCSHLQREKLFEVRFHGLPADKKRELEDTLRSFASSVGQNSHSEKRTRKVHASKGLLPNLQHQPSSSSTSESRPVDSAYASISGAGASQAQSNGGGLAYSRKDHVKSYLDDIPETLMPRKSTAMSIQAKSRLVVRRLEQIFTGKGAPSQQQNHTQQQQDVSTAAAEADWSKLEAGGQRVWREGTREAHILPDNADPKVDNLDQSSNTVDRSRDKPDGTNSVARGAEIRRPCSPEQRPTRPLDLDIHRAQVPSDNIDYIRHLGLASPNDEKDVMADGNDGWVFLNLLTSMAQLHTLNVTPEFVRNAVHKVSQRFELSADGTKVRWCGGIEGTRLSSDADDGEEPMQLSSGSSLFPSKRGSLDGSLIEGDGMIQPLDAQAGAKRRAVTLQDSSASEKFHYKPLFTHPPPSSQSQNGSGDESDTMDSTDSADLATGAVSNSNVIKERQSRFHGCKRENGPIIFYNRARFCTDLGGDPDAANEDIAYSRFTQQPVGCESIVEEDHELTDARQVNNMLMMDLDASPAQWPADPLKMDDLMTSISDCASEHTSHSPMELQASGLSGIRPTDNFIVNVQTRHGRKAKNATKLSPFSSPPKNSLPRRILHSMPRSAIDQFKQIPRSDASSKPEISTELVSAIKTTIPPSTLPPPSCVVLPFTSSESDGGNTEEDSDDASASSSFNPPAADATNPRRRSTTATGVQGQQQHLSSMTAYRDPQPHHAASSVDTETKESSYDEDDEGDDEEDDDDDDSIDLLAHARLQDPEAVRAREREFESCSGSSLSVAASIGGSEGEDEGKGGEEEGMSVDEEEGESEDE